MIDDDLAWLSVGGMAGAGLVGLLQVARWRATRQPDRWGALDLIIACGALFWGSALGGILGWRLTMGTWDPGADPVVPLSVAIAGTALGSCLASAYALRRAGPDGLGFAPARGRDYAAALALLLPFWGLSFGWSLVLEAQGVSEFEQDLLVQVRTAIGTPAGAGALLYGVLVAPVLEELLFRGFVLPPLVRRVGPWLGALSNGLLFGALHLADPWSVPPLVALGALLAWLRLRSNSVGPPILLHATNNAVVFASALLLD